MKSKRLANKKAAVTHMTTASPAAIPVMSGEPASSSDSSNRIGAADGALTAGAVAVGAAGWGTVVTTFGFTAGPEVAGAAAPGAAGFRMRELFRPGRLGLTVIRAVSFGG